MRPALLALCLAACGGAAASAPLSHPVVPVVPAAPATKPAPPSPPAAVDPKADAEAEERRAIEATLPIVARAHGLSIVHPVVGEVVSREQGIALITAKVKRDIPADVLAAQGETYAALELIPADYPFVEGMFALLRENVAGFYDPDADRMYLVDDLDDVSRGPTLSHELVHALQDQHFDLGGRLTYRRGELDSLAAISAFAEGDATSAMFSGPDGQARALSVEALRFSMDASVALSNGGAKVPGAMRASLVAPYVDGYRFVEALRDRGGWDAVNDAWKAPPRSTEQVLHVEKYDAHELPISVAVPTAAELGPGFRVLDSDVVGEQATRIAFTEWSSPPEGERAATGWGGDAFALFAREGEGSREYALAWRLRFDTPADASEAEALLKRRFPSCTVRPELGPLAWKRRERDLAVVAGPYRRGNDGKATASAKASCAAAARWLAEVLHAP